MKHKKRTKFAVTAILFIAIGLNFENVTALADDQLVTPYGEPFAVDCTAYCYTGNLTASGEPTVEGVTIAGRQEWLGKTCMMYACNEDGTVGDLIGIYEFTDTGWGIDGDILRGETVDLYFNDKQTCIDWGRKNVYIEVVDAVG